MRIITISREFGSGGRELGKRIAGILGFDYYDREIVTAISRSKGLDADYVERALDLPAGQRIPVTFRRSFTEATVMNGPQISLLLEQKKVIENIASIGKDLVIVGRNADVILKGFVEEGCDPASVQFGDHVRFIASSRRPTFTAFCRVRCGALFHDASRY